MGQPPRELNMTTTEPKKKHKRVADSLVRARTLEMCIERGPQKFVRPSEVARSLDPDDWQRLLRIVRRFAVELALEGRIQILRKGKPVDDPTDFKGVYHLRLTAEESSG